MEHSRELYKQSKNLEQLLEYMKQDLDEELRDLVYELLTVEQPEDHEIMMSIHDRATEASAQRRTVEYIRKYMRQYTKYR